MKFIVIDNLDWFSEGAGLTDAQPDIIDTSLFTLEEVVDYLKPKKNDNTVYFINVHLIFNEGKIKKGYKFQQQNGVVLYRQLLKLYEENEQSLKVVFFSPIEKDELIKLKPENAVLKHHLVLPVPFEWAKVVEQIENKTDWKIFNNASENLLSGFSMSGLQKIKTEGKKLLFIDDQSNEWKATFDAIFDNGAIEHLPFDNQQTFRENLTSGNVKKSADSKISNCHIVLSDFYLNENHEPNKWMNKENIEGISGFKLFKSIRETDKGKAIPFIMHTSSNKVSYYKIFDQNGVDDWIVKDIRPDTTAKEKKDNYFIFKQTIESFIDPTQYWIYERLQSVWLDIQQIDRDKFEKWWHDNKGNSIYEFTTDRDRNTKKVTVTYSSSQEFTKGDIVSILKSSWFAIRRYLNKETDYEKSDDTELFLASSICNNLGKIFEMLGIKSGDVGFSYLSNFILNVRNKASHQSDYKYFHLLDAFICMEWIVFALNNYDTLKKYRDAFDDDFIATDFIKGRDKTKEQWIFPCGLLWIYIQFYNHDSSKQNPPLRKLMYDKRIVPLFNAAKNDESIRGLFDFKENLNTYLAEIQNKKNQYGESDELRKEYKRTERLIKWLVNGRIPIFKYDEDVTIPTLNQNKKGQYLKILVPNLWQ